jgi:hypothetical protein
MEPFISRLLDSIFNQGLTFAMMALALWYMHVKLTKVETKIAECEQDRLKLWERISELK